MAQPAFLKHFVERLRGTEEGRVFLGGLLLLAAFLTEVILLLILAPQWGRPIAAAVPIDMFSGKEAALPVALNEGDTPWLLVAQVSALQHIALGTLAFPIFLFVLHRYHDRQNLVMRRFRRIQAAADRHRKVVDRFGGFGLFLFMLIPFLVNGPFVGYVIGRACGIRLRPIITAVVVATALSSAAWSYGYQTLLRLVEGIDAGLAKYVTIGIIAFFVGWALFDEWRDRRKERGEGKASAQAVAQAADEAARDASRKPPTS